LALFRKACDLGREHACTNLGIVYESGHGVPFGLPQSKDQAAHFYANGCALGDSDGCDRLKKMGR
jgi:hypothetical protein